MGTDDLVALYLREGGGHPLLEKHEELNLAGLWQEAVAARVQLSRPHTPEQHASLQSCIRRGDEARHHLLRANLRLVVSIAVKYRGYGVPLDDLIQEGNLGLLHALDKFDPKRGNKFSTYATWWIRHAVGRAVADHGRTIRLPVNLHDKIRQLHRAEQELRQAGQAIADEQLLTHLGWSQKRLARVRRAAEQVWELDAPRSSNEGAEAWHEAIGDGQHEPFTHALDRARKEALEMVLLELPICEAQVLRERYGLYGTSATPAEVGKRMNLTPTRVRQLENSALKRLRHPRYARRLRGLLEGARP